MQLKQYLEKFLQQIPFENNKYFRKTYKKTKYQQKRKQRIRFFLK